MPLSRSIRQTYRWLSVAFTITVIANIVSAALSGPVWIGYLALPPLVLMLITGLYLFVLPYRSDQRPAQRATS